ncbi:MAG: two-component system sensor histidine kinase NtrB [Myxococcota bacterium]
MPAPSSSSSPRSSIGQFADLRVKLTWLALFRTVATSLLLAAIVVRLLSAQRSEELSAADSASFAVIGLVYVLTLIYGLVLRRGRVGRGAAYVQVLGDVVLASALVYLTGGADSPFTFTYLIAVIAASILIGQRGALIAAATSSVAYTVLTLSIHLGAMQPPQGSPTLSASRVAFLLTSGVLAQLLVAVLAGYLARLLSAAGGRLQAREADLRELVGLQNQIVAAMPGGLITCEADGRITFVNPAAAAILGLMPEQKNLEEVIPGALRLAPQTPRAELTVETPAGRRIIGLTVTPLEGSRGSLLIVFQDLTDLRRIEEELRSADHLASLGKLSAQLAHEIRNPLASMRGSAQMLAKEPAADEVARRLANILVRESDRLSGLVEDFLRFARPPPPSRRPVNLGTLVAETVQMLRADPLARGVTLQEELADVTCEVDDGQIRQVLINLLRNAFAAVGEGGVVKVVVDQADGQVQLRVWDSAGSIDPKDAPRLFEPFYTTREGGTGLGLSTAYSIVAAHGGKIRLASSPSTGTEFVVGLPSSFEPARENSSRR